MRLQSIGPRIQYDTAQTFDTFVLYMCQCSVFSSVLFGGAVGRKGLPLIYVTHSLSSLRLLTFPFSGHRRWRVVCAQCDCRSFFTFRGRIFLFLIKYRV